MTSSSIALARAPEAGTWTPSGGVEVDEASISEKTSADSACCMRTASEQVRRPRRPPVIRHRHLGSRGPVPFDHAANVAPLTDDSFAASWHSPATPPDADRHVAASRRRCGGSLSSEPNAALREMIRLPRAARELLEELRSSRGSRRSVQQVLADVTRSSSPAARRRSTAMSPVRARA